MDDRRVAVIFIVLAAVAAVFMGVGIMATILLVNAWLDRKRPYSL